MMSRPVLLDHRKVAASHHPVSVSIVASCYVCWLILWFTLQFVRPVFGYSESFLDLQRQ